jgi:hypothetical protein
MLSEFIETFFVLSSLNQSENKIKNCFHHGYNAHHVLNIPKEYETKIIFLETTTLLSGVIMSTDIQVFYKYTDKYQYLKAIFYFIFGLVPL